VAGSTFNALDVNYKGGPPPVNGRRVVYTTVAPWPKVGAQNDAAGCGNPSDPDPRERRLSPSSRHGL